CVIAVAPADRLLTEAAKLSSSSLDSFTSRSVALRGCGIWPTFVGGPLCADGGPLGAGAAPPHAASAADRPMTTPIASDRFRSIELDSHDGMLTGRAWLTEPCGSSMRPLDSRSATTA